MQTKNEQQKPTASSPIFFLNWNVLEKLIKTIGSLHAETGGAVGGSEDTTEISHFQFDESSRNSAVTYSPDYNGLNRIFKKDWNPRGIRLRGFIHSHPGSMSRPSFGDEVYAERILSVIKDMDCLWLPIINTIPDTGRFQLTPWVVYPKERGVAVVKGKVQVVDVPSTSSLKINGQSVLKSIKANIPLDHIAIGRKRPAPHKKSTYDQQTVISTTLKPDVTMTKITTKETSVNRQESLKYDIRNTFNRVNKTYYLSLMKNSRIIAVGAGGAADWLEQLARCGVGQFIMIDPDIVEETNLATQQTYRRDIGRPKVDCIAERIRDINPTAKTISFQKSLDDIDDEEIRRLACDPIDGRPARRVVICGLTDDFWAQARVNRIALHLGIPSLSAQVYKEGRGAEVTFTYPGITPACQRCVTSSRYKYYIDQGQKNDVTSHGTPIFSTTRLNAIKGNLMMAILHHESNHPRWGNMLTRIGKRNLVQIRLDPDFSETLGIKIFDRVFEHADNERLFFDEVVWLPQEQECPETGYPVCPDCGGTGDLTDAIGTLKDTRLVLRENNSKQPAKETISHSINAYA